MRPISSSLAIGLLALVFSCQNDILQPEKYIESNTISQTNGRLRVGNDIIVSPFNYCDTVSTIGGGVGYKYIVTNPSYTVKTVSELEDKILNAPPNSRIMLDGIFNLDHTLVITKPLTIAGNRGAQVGVGYSSGATIVNTSNASNSVLFLIQSTGVRITGLQIVGNSNWVLADIAVKVDPAFVIKRIEVDNCEISLFAIGISVDHQNAWPAGYEVKVHNNDFHDNRFFDTSTNLENLGYGVDVGDAFVKIYGNIFQLNRHDITGTGAIGSGYEASCNTVLGSDATTANFDMHGRDGNKELDAGAFIHIHHNDFKNLNCQGNIFITGKPTILCLIDNNRFRTGRIYATAHACDTDPNTNVAILNNITSDAILRTPEGFGNVVAVNNLYGYDPNTLTAGYLGWYVKEDWTINSQHNFFRIPSTNDMLHSCLEPDTVIYNNVPYVDFSVAQNLDYWFGDFNGDGKTDIFKAEKSKYYYIPLDAGIASAWTSVTLPNGSFRPLGSTSLANVQLDLFKITPSVQFVPLVTSSKTELIIQESSFIRVLTSSGWIPKVSTSQPLTDHHFGAFKKSGSTQNFSADAFHIKVGGQWETAYDFGNISSFTPTTFANIPFSNTKVGDFNGDSYADIFYTDVPNSQQWKYSSGSIGSWTPLSSSGVPPDQLTIGNMNGDAKSDVIGLDQGIWKVSTSGTGSWQTANTANYSLSTFGYGKLN